jgi:biopolymer transport protein TolR
MAIALGAGGKKKAVEPAMNVTPLVDVVLVLLIIFMVITPLLAKNFWVHLPKQDKEEVTRQEADSDPTPPLVLHVGPNRSIAVNGSQIPFEELSGRLRRMFAARDDHVLFFDAADDAEYGFTVEVMDQARDGGAVTIATLTTALEAPAAPAPAPAP